MDDTVRVEEIRPARERAAEAPICLAVIIWLARVVFRHSVTPSRRRPEAQLCSPSLGSLGNGSVTLVPMALSTLAFVGAIWRGVSAEVFFCRHRPGAVPFNAGTQGLFHRPVIRHDADGVFLVRLFSLGGTALAW
ncbi:hypothetical protein EZH22_28475 [Xanthobacter dioxanivorans]|uniref:Uncharacterized protein n=1 Tax=Xanthobacter dioxanivorans TaxID=2528964 RepID=A0A974PNA9_9HYPH|nr:hypothetical protein [Xanthobacter dioxanivorans]QRG06763.1 hypothetical protein EZH22_28475 [Xanthobacter dioxanivorans]